MFTHQSIQDRCARLRAVAECFPHDVMPDVRSFTFATADVLEKLHSDHARLLERAAAAVRSGDLAPLRAELDSSAIIRLQK